MYHRHVVSSKAFKRIDREMFLSIWRWARYRHPKKSRKWIKRRYFKRVGSWSWVFYGEYYGREYHLMRARSVKIQRHTKVRHDVNPYDPEWEIYLEKRLGLKMAKNLRGRRKLLYLWREQNGICPVCDQKPKSPDGTTIISNGDLMEAQIMQTIASCYIRTAIGKYTARNFLLRNRVRQRAFKRLEPYDWKLSCTVLRGGSGGNATSLPGE